MSALDNEDLTTWSVASLISVYGSLREDAIAFRRSSLHLDAAESYRQADRIAAEITRRTTT